MGNLNDHADRGGTAVTLRYTNELLRDVEVYISERYIPEPDVCMVCGGVPLEADLDAAPMALEDLRSIESPASMPSAPAGKASEEKSGGLFGLLRRAPKWPDSIDDLLACKDLTFSEVLLHEIDARRLADPEVYKRANIDRRLFSKIRGNAQYQPKKSTAVALALALNMNLDDTLDLIGRAGYTLTTSSKADIIVMYFIEHECWDVNLINQVLYKFEQPLVGR